MSNKVFWRLSTLKAKMQERKQARKKCDWKEKFYQIYFFIHFPYLPAYSKVWCPPRHWETSQSAFTCFSFPSSVTSRQPIRIIKTTLKHFLRRVSNIFSLVIIPNAQMWIVKKKDMDLTA
ncbi:hypothetical protein ILYODFUR_021913 [Ilyodon furcidens]|uniref:Uncharacterized protein n=1 Tax=Ilyodon furcidens TaxID=33524 RepID=A0ABV0UA26_9TELE